MPPSNPHPPSRGLKRDVLATERSVTITCPNCLGSLRIKAHLKADAPCPICQHPLHYDPRPQGEAFTFVPKQPVAQGQPKAPEPIPTIAARLRSKVKSIFTAAFEFLNSPTGVAMAWITLAILLASSAFLFVQADKRRTERENRLKAIEAERPSHYEPDADSPVPLLPGEPKPLDPLILPE